MHTTTASTTTTPTVTVETSQSSPTRKVVNRYPPPSPTRPRSFTTTTQTTIQPHDVEQPRPLTPNPPSTHRKLSPGLAARLKLFDPSTKNLPTLSRSSSSVGRIPQEHLKGLDSAHQNLSIKIEKRGRSWSQNFAEDGQGRQATQSDERDLRTRKSEPQLSPIEPLPLPELSVEKEVDMAIVEGSSVVFEKQDAVPGSTFDTQSPDSDPEQFSGQSTPESEYPPSVPPKDYPSTQAGPSEEGESYFNPFGLSRTSSIYSLSRVSFNSQLSQLTSLNLPQASSLSASISAIPTAPAAVKALISAAEQMQRWIQKATEVLGGLNAEDDIEWAAAGKEGLDDVDKAVSKFESLVGIYVQAIEELQLREDIADASADGLEKVVAHMEKTLKEWEGVKSLLKGVKGQVELAMEWEELWSVVLGDVGMEVESLSGLIFEMEEKRHKTITTEVESDSTGGVDINELETIVEESPSTSRPPANYRFSLPPSFAATTSANTPNPSSVQDDSNLLALFARMQPLRASLDFLPMRLSMFQSRAETIFPTACEELESRRNSLERGWKRLEADAEALRRELGEDRWILVFRNAGRQAQKMCESVERSINKLQEALDAGTQHSNPSALAKKVESFEAKKMHYGSAIERVLAIIQRGVNDRLTVNGEIIRLHSDMSTRWNALAERMRLMDRALDEENAARHQQLRDSISSIISIDRSAATSTIDTPGSSPASSVVNSGGKGDPTTPGMRGTSRRGSASTNRPSTNRRYVSMPQGPAATTHLPRMNSIPRAVTTNHALPSPSQTSSNGTSVTPRQSSRLERPSPSPLNNKPRWNSSPNTKDLLIGHNFRPLSQTTPSPYRKVPPPTRTPTSYSSIPLPSPLSRETPSSPATSIPSSTSTSTRRQSHIPTSSPLAPRIASPSPARSWAQQQAHLESSAAAAKPRSTLSSRRSSIGPAHMVLPKPNSISQTLETTASPDDYESSPSIRPKSMARPVSVLAANRSGPGSVFAENVNPQQQPQPTERSRKRMSMLPQPKGRGGRESSMDGRVKSGSWMRDSSGERPPWR